jgi:antitoxin component YwqK of YwqJK toxin-antitoxin module
MKLRTILTSLFILLLLSQSAIAINSDVAKNPLLSFEPKLYMKSINGSDLHVLKGSDEPYTGLASITNSIWKDVVIKESFVDGRQSLGTKTFYNKSTGEKLSGEFDIYYPDGVKYGVINLVDGKQDGITTKWHPNGKLKSTFNYSMGVEDGMFSIFYENGNKKQTGVNGPNESKQWTDWNISGYKESFYHFKVKDKPPISSKHWDSKGRRDGSWIDSYDDGTMFKRKHYTHGDPSLDWTLWHPNGTKHTEINFMFGLLNGPVKYWNKEGVLVVDGQFKDSKEIGKWTFKDNDGNPIQRPKDFHINITDEDDTITTIGKNDKGDNMMEFYISIYMPLAIALLILLPLLGIGMCWLYRKAKQRKS